VQATWTFIPVVLCFPEYSSLCPAHDQHGSSVAQKADGAVELREVAGERADLLAEVAGLTLGTIESKGDEYRALGQAVADLCRLAGADESQILQWTEEGRRRAELRRKPPFSDPARRAPRRP
jgi:hypothetical protein